MRRSSDGYSGFDYERFQLGASPVTIPLRYPGQYHDEETDLFENWHRYYDADVGRYLEPDPTRMRPASRSVAVALGGRGSVVHDLVYSYANNNPLYFLDPRGFDPKGDFCRAHPGVCPPPKLPQFCKEHPAQCSHPPPPPTPSPGPMPGPGGECHAQGSGSKFAACVTMAAGFYVSCMMSGGVDEQCRALFNRIFVACMYTSPPGTPPPFPN